MNGIKRYCYHCGASLMIMTCYNQPREMCPECGWVYYKQLKVGAAAVIERDNQLLLLRRAHHPWRGYWNLPAGYVESDEDPRCAAERETLEECNLVVRAGDLLGAFYFSDDPRGHGLLMVYLCQWLSGSPRVDPDEVLEFGFFDVLQLPKEITGAGHERAIQMWAARQVVG